MKKIITTLSLVAALIVRAETTTINISDAAGMEKELGADDVLVVNVSGNSDQSTVDWTGITGTGTIKFQGSGVVTLPKANYRFAETISLCSDADIALDYSYKTNSSFVVRNFAGSAQLRLNTLNRETAIKTVQTARSEWSGVIDKSKKVSSTSTCRVVLYVASDSEPSEDKALIVSGNQTDEQLLEIEETGCVILKGQWKGTINNNGLLIIRSGIDRTLFNVKGNGVTVLPREKEVLVIAPPDLKAMWEGEFKDAYAEIHPGYTCKVVGTDEIYRDYSYDAANTDGAPRNPAESIHAFIKNANLKDGNQYFILGGPWINIDDLATNKVMKLATGETLTLANTVPGVRINTYKDSHDNVYHSPSDMYYACFDSNNTYAWDADGNGMYLESTEFTNSDMTANVIVTRIPLVTYADWKHTDGTIFSQRELLAAYVLKLQKGLAADFDGMNRYGFYAYVVDIEDKGYGTGREITVQRLGGDCDAYVERKETAFYDGGYNMFDPARANDRFVLAEGVSRRHVRDQIVQARPVDAVNGFYEETFSRKHNTREEARASWTGENYALRFYYAHGNRGGGHGFGMDDYKADGCGLTLFDDCAGPCSTGKIEFDANGVYLMNYAIGCVMSPFGGSLTTINNSDNGIGDMNNFFKGFQPNDSWRYANNYLVGFVLDNMNVGEAWKYNVTDFVTNYKYNKSALDTWMLAEEMLLGDPLVKLPAVTENLAYADGITYKGLANKKDVVVSMQIEGDKVIDTPSAPLKVMSGLKTSGSSLTICTGEGGIGGDGVTFAGEKGTLTLAGNEPFYVAGVKNGNKVVVNGKGATLDFDSFEISALEIGEGADVTIRSNKRGALAKIGNALTIPANATVRLATWDAFGDTRGTITVGDGAKLIIEANPSYHDGNNRGEALNAEIVFVDEESEIPVEQGAIYIGVINPAIKYLIKSREGLGGDITIPKSATVVLSELPLSKIGTLTVESGATLVIPEGKTLDDLLSSGTATLKSGVKIACGAETATLSEEKTVDGSMYVTKYYYTSDTTDWTNSVKMSLDPNGVADTLPTEGGEVIFAKGTTFPAAEKDNLYVHDNVLCKSIHVTDSTTLKLGAESGQKWNLRSGFKVTVDEGSTLILRGWGNGGQKETNPAKVADGVVFDGDGVVTIDVNDAPICTWGNISGTATISLPVGVTINCSGTISNSIEVPEGCQLKITVDGATTTYKAVAPRTLYWTGTTETIQDWRTVSGISLKDAANQTATYEDGDTIVVNVSSILYLHDAVTGIKLRLEGEGTNVRFLRSGDASGADYVLKGVSVEVAEGATMTIPKRQNSANAGWDSYNTTKPKQSEIKDSTIFGAGSVVVESGAVLVLTDSTITAPITIQSGASLGEEVTASAFGITNTAFAEDDRMTLAKIVGWMNAKGVSATAINALSAEEAEDAFLLNCAPSELSAAKAAFKFDSIVPGEEPTIDGDYNGTVIIITTDISGGKLYKATLKR